MSESDGSAGTRRVGSRAWGALAMLSVAELMGMSLWFTASAVSPELSAIWGLTQSEAGWLTTVVQLGFVGGTAAAALLNLADVIPAARYFAVSALAGAAANVALLGAPGYASALALRFLTGFFLAGVYPPAMKMISTWFKSARGFAIGTIVGALTVGKAAPYLMRSIEGAGIQLVVIGASLAAAAGGLLVLVAYRDGPHGFDRRPFSWKLVGVVLRHRETRLAIGGYLGHMWELYPMWAMISLFFVDFYGRSPGSAAQAAALAGGTAFVVIAVGGLGAVLAGTWADRLGRERVTVWSMGVSATCAITIGWLTAAPMWLVLGVATVWGFSVVADSAQFSAVVTEVAPSHAVGTALTLQTSLGFLLTAATIWLTIELETAYGWRVAFGVLALGPMVGIVIMRRLQTLRAT